MSVLAPDAEQPAHIRLNTKQVHALLDRVEGSPVGDALVKEIRRNVRVVHPGDLPVRPPDAAALARLADATARAQAIVAKLHAVRRAQADQLRRQIERTHQQAAQLPSLPPLHIEPNPQLQSLAAHVNDGIDDAVNFIRHLAEASEDTNKRVQNVTTALEIANDEGSIADQDLVAEWTATFSDIPDQQMQFPIPAHPTEHTESYPDEPFVTPRSKMRKRAAALSRMSPRERRMSNSPK